MGFDKEGWDRDCELFRSDGWTLDGERYASVMAREWLRVRGRNGRLTPLLANKMQQEYERRRGRANIVLKARQMGMTTWVAGRFFLKTIVEPGVLTVQVAQTREAAEGIFQMVQRMWENLPDALREGPLKRRPANMRQMFFPAIDSGFRVLSANMRNCGRGLTIQNLHCSEVSRWPGDAAETLAGLRAALVPDGEICLESTPNGAYGCFYDEWMRGSDTPVDGELTRHFFPWWMEEAYVSSAVTDLNDEELRLIDQHGLTPEQIGYRRTLEQSYQGLRAQEFAEDALSCFKASGDCCFDVEAVDARLASIPEPLKKKRGGALLVWLEPVAGREYLVAVDTAGGGSTGDYAAVQVIDRASGLQCAELRQRLSVSETAAAAAALAREYNGALLVVERNNHGSGVLAHLDSQEHYQRVYGHDGVAGWLTSTGNKPGMVSRMGALLRESPTLFFSKRLLKECRSFVSFSGGRTGAAKGAHDDCLMAMAIGQAVRAELVR